MLKDTPAPSRAEGSDKSFLFFQTIATIIWLPEREFYAVGEGTRRRVLWTIKHEPGTDTPEQAAASGR